MLGGTLALFPHGEIRVQRGEGLGWLTPATSLGGVTCRLLRRNCIFLRVGDKLKDFQFSKALTMLGRLSWHKRLWEAHEGAFPAVICELAL